MIGGLHKRSLRIHSFGRTPFGDPVLSGAKCNMNHLTICPRHQPQQYTWFARHKKGKHE